MADSSSQPAFVLAGDHSHTPAFFGRLIEELEKYGIESLAVAYPTCGKNTKGTTQHDEVIAIRNEIRHFIDEKNKDVVLTLHSYGGWPGSRAVNGLDKETRLKQGKKTGIVEIIFIVAFLLPDNAPVAHYSYLPPWLTVKDGTRIPNETSVPLLFSDLEPDDQKYWFTKFEPQRNAFDDETVPGAPWHLPISKTYIFCMNDQTMSIDFQINMLKSVIDNTWSIKSIKAGHEPFLTKPAELAELLLTPSH